MAQIPEIEQYKEGNFAELVINPVRSEVCRIEEVEREKDIIKKYIVSTKEEKNLSVENSLLPIKLTSEHLKKLGFHYNLLNHTFELLELVVTYVGETDYTDPMNVLYKEALMHIVKPFHSVPKRFEDFTSSTIEENTFNMFFIHWFQNYCKQQGREINFEQLFDITDIKSK